MPATTTRGLGFAAAVLTVALASSTASSQTIEIDPATAIGPTIKRAGWDIKAWPLRLNSSAEVNRLYNDADANFLRVPIFANAHNEDGSVNASLYEDELNAINAVVAGRPDVEIYASLKLLGANTFPDWVSEPTSNWGAETGRIFGNTVDRPNPEHYSSMIAGYVKYMQDNGVNIDFIGLNNETEDAVPVDRYIGTYDLLPSALSAAGVTTENQDFQFVGPDSFGLPTAERFVQGLNDAGRLDTIDFAASHYYPQHTSGNESDWQDLSQKSGGLDLWHTEVHMPGNSAAINDLSQTVRDSLSVLFASVRNGADSYIWWESPNTIDTIREIVKTQVNDTVLGAAPVFTTPSYDGKGDPDGQPLFQAFVEGNEVTLWIVNPGDELINLPVDLLSESLDASVTGVGYLAPDGDQSWDPSETLTLGITSDADGLGFTVDSIAAQSIGVISFSTPPPLPGDFDNDGDADIDDIDLLSANFGLTGANTAMDLNNDGAIDFVDLFLHVTGQVMDANGTGALFGDLNLDGDVDVSQISIGPGGVLNLGDASVLLASLGTETGASYADGDLNGDGDVDVSQIIAGPGGVANLGDASILLASLGQSTAGAAAASTVPEPNSFAILAMIGIGAVIRHRRW